jgi:hypothetical protein
MRQFAQAIIFGLKFFALSALSSSGLSFAGDTLDPVGLYFGTTAGAIWASVDEGARWRCIAEHLPEIYAVETGMV